jgi:hypothetical protein
VEFVVDENGVPVASPVRLVRSTSSEISQALLRGVPDLRFAPALKDGEPVRQLVRFGMGIMITRNRASPATMSPAGLPRSCRRGP